MLRLWRRLLPCLLLTKRIIRAFRKWLCRLPNVLTPGQKRIRRRSIIRTSSTSNINLPWLRELTVIVVPMTNSSGRLPSSILLRESPLIGNKWRSISPLHIRLLLGAIPLRWACLPGCNRAGNIRVKTWSWQMPWKTCYWTMLPRLCGVLTALLSTLLTATMPKISFGDALPKGVLTKPLHWFAPICLRVRSRTWRTPTAIWTTF